MFLNTRFLCKNYVTRKINIKARVKNIIPSLFQSCLRKMNQQIGKIDKYIDKEI